MIDLPSEAFPFLLHQRTQFKGCPQHEAQAGYMAEIDEFVARVRPSLPQSKPQMRFVDIGCGIGFSLLSMLKIYGPENNFVGVDRGVQDSSIVYGFSKNPSAYNSLNITRDILISNGVSSHNVELVDVDMVSFPSGKADIVISTLAWGFHFPVQVYLDQVEAMLAEDGVVVIDVRRGFDQDAILKQRLDAVQVWPDSNGKSDQMVLKRKPR